MTAKLSARHLDRRDAARLALVGPDQLALREDVALDGIVEVVLRHPGRVGLVVERVDLEEVAMAAARRIRAVPARRAGIVRALDRARWQASAGGERRDVG